MKLSPTFPAHLPTLPRQLRALCAAAGLALMGLLGLGGLSTPAGAATTIADWSFNEAAGTTLNLTSNAGTGLGGPPGQWDVAVPGVATTGAGSLLVRNTGGGGSGTRTTYADFGPVPAAVGSGILSLYARFSGWDFGMPMTDGPVFTLALIEGNDFATALFSLQASPAGLRLGGGSDPGGNGGSIAGAAWFDLSSAQALTVRLSVDLDNRGYSLAYDSGSGFQTLGIAAIDSLTLGVNSLRMAMAGNFSAGLQPDSGLAIDRIWVVDQDPLAPIPEPASAALLLLGLGLLVLRRQQRAQPACP